MLPLHLSPILTLQNLLLHFLKRPQNIPILLKNPRSIPLVHFHYRLTLPSSLFDEILKRLALTPLHCPHSFISLT